MELILATSNRGKVREFKELLGDITPYTELMEEIDIKEDGDSFKQNALIKAKSVYDRLKKRGEYIVLADDSGISVPALGGEPGIYSARYAGEGAGDRDNLNKLVEKIRSLGLKRTPAYYTAAIAIVSPFGSYTVHGWMWGDVITTPRGQKGFGYDPIFIPKGYEKTLGELDSSIKSKISHRAKAMELAKKVLEVIS